MKYLPSLLLILAFLAPGCSLVPKRVEFFQAKVQEFPTTTEKEKEIEKQAILLAHERAVETVQAALIEQASTNVTVPAKQVERLTEAVVIAEGPPQKPATAAPEIVAAKVIANAAKQDVRVEDFRKENDKYAGKKIEDTGLIKVPYFAWAGGIIGGIVLLFIIGKLILTALSAVNPGAAVGLNILKTAQSVVTKGFSQIVQGGEKFKDWVKSEINDPALQKKILDAFQSHQQKSQDEDVQKVVETLTR